jgi:hypothetical protein
LSFIGIGEWFFLSFFFARKKPGTEGTTGTVMIEINEMLQASADAQISLVRKFPPIVLHCPIVRTKLASHLQSGGNLIFLVLG